MYQTHWISPSQLPQVFSQLCDLNLMKFDPDGAIPLKNGRTTDIYLDLRNARSNPKALKYLSHLFAAVLHQTHLQRFVEVPDSVSCIAGPLSMDTGVPYLTIREHAKAGRASDARVIGEYHRGDRVVILDDVITDGASKITPIRACAELGLEVLAVLVLVDREAGWQDVFRRERISVPVWAGTTLSRMRASPELEKVMKRSL